MRTKLVKMREAYGFTQQTFADAIGVSRSHYTHIEAGRKSPSLKVAIRIKKALNYDDDDIFVDKK